MERCDVVDRSGARTGRVVRRGTALAPDEYYLVVHVWIRNERAEYLIQQRAWHLESGPGVWATTVGYVWSGEDSLAAARRETREELGLQLAPGQFRQLDRFPLENRVQDIWLAEVSRAAVGQPVPGPEVADWKWATKAQLKSLISLGGFFAYSYFDSLPA